MFCSTMFFGCPPESRPCRGGGWTLGAMPTHEGGEK